MRLTMKKEAEILEKRMKATGKSISHFLRKAKLGASTFDKWKSGKADPLTKFNALVRVVEKEERIQHEKTQ